MRKSRISSKHSISEDVSVTYEDGDADEVVAGFVQTIKRVSIKLGALKSSFKDLDLKVGKLEKKRKNLVSHIKGFDYQKEIMKILDSKQEFKTKDDIFERLSSLLKRAGVEKPEKSGGKGYSVNVLPDNFKRPDPGPSKVEEEENLPYFGTSKNREDGYQFPGKGPEDQRKGKIELKIETIHHPDRPGQSSMNISGLEHFVNGPNHGTQNPGANTKKSKLELTVQQISNYYHHPPDFSNKGGQSDREMSEKPPPSNKADKDRPQTRILKAGIGSIDKKFLEDPTGSKAANMEALQNTYHKNRSPNKIFYDHQSDSKSLLQDKISSERDRPQKGKPTCKK